MGPREIARSKDVTANSIEKAGKAGKAGPRPWDIEPYIYQESSIDDQRSSHNDPRLEFALQSHGQHPDGNFIPSDGDSQSLHPSVGLGAMPDLHASDLGTLAGGGCFSTPEQQQQQKTQKMWSKMQRLVNDHRKQTERLANDHKNQAQSTRGKGGR